MTTLSEIEHAADALTPEHKQLLVRFLLTRLGAQEVTPSVTQHAPGHRILDIQPVHLGAVLRPLTADDDLLGEMLEGRT